MATTPFEVFGKYLLLSRIATGGMAEIFLARPAATDANGRLLVIKRILSHIATDPAFVKMFRAETQICLGFDNPNTVHFHDFGQTGQQLYIAMEYIEGKSLRQLALKCSEQGYKVPVNLTVSLLAQAAAGLHYAHTFENHVTGEKLNIIHRDVTPHNLIVSYGGNLKIIDFGIAKAAVESADRTQTGMIKGKAGYLSPEQTMGNVADPRSDIFALGIILWELLTGQRLFAAQGESEVTIMARIKNCEMHLTPPSSRNSSVPKELDCIVLKALAKDPGQRFQTAGELQKALRDFMLRFDPSYSYADVGTTIKQIFKREMEDERRQVQVLNEKAQQFLSFLDPESKTTAMPMDENTVINDPTGGMWIKMLQRIKQENKQATFRHYFLLVVYVVTIVGLKLDQEKMFLSRWLTPPEKIQMASTVAPSVVKKSKGR